MSADKALVIKDKERKSSSKDLKLQEAMAKDPGAVGPSVSQKEIVELVNKVGGRQAEVLRKEFSQGQAAISTEVKGLATVMNDIARTIQELKVPPAGGSKDILPPAPCPVFVNPPSPKISAPVLNFKLPMPGMEDDEEMVDEAGDTDEDDEDKNLMDYVHKKTKKKVEPTMETTQLWAQYCKKTTDFRTDDWRIMGSLPNVKAYTDHPGAAMFKAPEVDPQAPNLKFKDKKDREKKLEKLQTMAGAIGHMSCEMIVDINTEMVRIGATIQDFLDPAVVIEDPRREAVEILSAIKDNVFVPIGLSAGAVAEVAGAAHNSFTLDRRQPMVDMVMQEKNARTIVKRLQPSEKYLFGGHLAEVARDLKDSSHLNVLTGFTGAGSEFKKYKPYPRGGGSFRARGFRGFRGGRGGNGYRGRAGQFGKKKI